MKNNLIYMPIGIIYILLGFILLTLFDYTFWGYITILLGGLMFGWGFGNAYKNNR